MTVIQVNKDITGKLPKQTSDTTGKANIRFMNKVFTFMYNNKLIHRFSTIVDIGKATFSYDMRRLTEILAFPKVI